MTNPISNNRVFTSHLLFIHSVRLIIEIVIPDRAHIPDVPGACGFLKPLGMKANPLVKGAQFHI